MIKWKVNIPSKSIKLVQDRRNKNLYWIDFEYSATEPSKVSIYFCANQITNAEGQPSYFTIPPELPSAAVINLDEGKNINFSGESEANFDVQNYENMPLFNATDNYFPCIITIEPTAKPQLNEDGISDYQNVINYCKFTIEKKTNILNLKPIKQVLIAYDLGFNIQQIYGMTDALEEHKGPQHFSMLADEAGEADDGQLCVICLSEEKNCVVMPCGHLWVCKDCATTIAKQQNPDCPICREKVKTFVPLNIESIKHLEDKTVSMRTKSFKIKNNKSESNSYEEGYNPEESSISRSS